MIKNNEGDSNLFELNCELEFETTPSILASGQLEEPPQKQTREEGGYLKTKARAVSLIGKVSSSDL